MFGTCLEFLNNDVFTSNWFWKFWHVGDLESPRNKGFKRANLGLLGLEGS